MNLGKSYGALRENASGDSIAPISMWHGKGMGGTEYYCCSSLCGATLSEGFLVRQHVSRLINISLCIENNATLDYSYNRTLTASHSLCDLSNTDIIDQFE